MLKTDPETKRKNRYVKADKYLKSLILNQVKEKIWKMIKNTRLKITNIVK